MKLALVTTTIGIPEVLQEYRVLDPDVPFVIAGDKKTPDRDIKAFADMLGNCDYLSPEWQEFAYPELSAVIGWNSIQRRNIAILHAAKWFDADVIVSVDDDNAPMGNYFEDVKQAFKWPWVGNVAQGSWFNIGELATTPYIYRGFPFRQIDPAAYFGPNNGTEPRQVGIVNGLIYGDPDVNAVERIETNPQVSEYTWGARRGIALDPKLTWSPVNAQNTAYRAELAPLMLQLPHVGRYDDIWGSYIAQAVLRDTPYHVLFGPPFVDQDRHPHDLEKDLDDEVLGMTYSLMLCDHIRTMQFEETPILGRLDEVVAKLADGLEIELPWTFFQEWLDAWR